MQEWTDAEKHLVNHDPYRPPINCFVIASFSDNLRSDILDRSTEGIRQLAFRDILCESEVDQFDIALLVYHAVFKLHISVNQVF